MCFLVSINLVPRWGYRMTLRVRPMVNIFEGVKQHMPYTEILSHVFFCSRYIHVRKFLFGDFTLNGYLVIVVCYKIKHASF